MSQKGQWCLLRAELFCSLTLMYKWTQIGIKRASPYYELGGFVVESLAFNSRAFPLAQAWTEESSFFPLSYFSHPTRLRTMAVNHRGQMPLPPVLMHIFSIWWRSDLVQFASNMSPKCSWVTAGFPLWCSQEIVKPVRGVAWWEAFRREQLRC